MNSEIKVDGLFVLRPSQEVRLNSRCETILEEHVKRGKTQKFKLSLKEGCDSCFPHRFCLPYTRAKVGKTKRT